MNMYKAGLITLLTLTATGCAGEYANFEMHRKDNSGKMIKTEVSIGTEPHFTLTTFTRPVIVEEIDGVQNRYVIESVDSKKWKLEKILTDDGKLPEINRNNNPKAYRRGQEIVNMIKDTVDAKATRNLR